MPVTGEFFPDNAPECTELIRLAEQEGRKLIFTLQRAFVDDVERFYVKVELDPIVQMRGSARMTS